MVKYQKKYKKNNEIINDLISEGFSIKKSKEAEDILNIFGYESFKPYIDSLRDINDKFPINCDFSDAISRYERDMHFRGMIFYQINLFEVFLKNCLTQVLGGQFGHHPYYDINVYDGNNFSSKKENKEYICSYFKKQIKFHKYSRNRRVLDYKKNYTNPVLPPVWDMASVCTFGDLIKWYKKLSVSIKEEISKKFSIDEISIFESWIDNILEIRNECAHQGVLFNIKVKSKPEFFRKIQFPKCNNLSSLKASLEILDFLNDNLNINLMGKNYFTQSTVKIIEGYFNINNVATSERALSGF